MGDVEVDAAKAALGRAATAEARAVIDGSALDRLVQDVALGRLPAPGVTSRGIPLLLIDPARLAAATLLLRLANKGRP